MKPADDENSRAHPYYAHPVPGSVSNHANQILIKRWHPRQLAYIVPRKRRLIFNVVIGAIGPQYARISCGKYRAFRGIHSGEGIHETTFKNCAGSNWHFAAQCGGWLQKESLRGGTTTGAQSRSSGSS